MVYFKTSEQKIWDAICTISNIKWGVISASLNFQIKKSEKTPVLHLMYQVSTFYDEKSLSNQKKHLQLLKVMLQIGSFNCPESNANNFSCTAFRKMRLSLFARKIIKAISQSRFMFSQDKHGAQNFMK